MRRDPSTQEPEQKLFADATFVADDADLALLHYRVRLHALFTENYLA